MLIKPYSDPSIVGTTHSDFDPTEYPYLKHCYPCNETSGTTLADIVAGNTITATASLTNPATGAVNFAAGTTHSVASTFITPADGSDLLLIGFGTLNTANAQTLSFGDSTVAGPGIGFNNNATTASFVTLDGSNYGQTAGTGQPVNDNTTNGAFGTQFDSITWLSL